MRHLISWKACLPSLSLTGLSVVWWGTGCLKRHFYSFTSLVFVSEAASKADLYFPYKGGQVYCVVCLVIYGAGRAPRPLPVPALKERHQERLQLCWPLRPAGDVGMALGSCCPPDSDKPVSTGLKKPLC